MKVITNKVFNGVDISISSCYACELCIASTLKDKCRGTGKIIDDPYTIPVWCEHRQKTLFILEHQPNIFKWTVESERKEIEGLLKFLQHEGLRVYIHTTRPHLMDVPITVTIGVNGVITTPVKEALLEYVI